MTVKPLTIDEKELLLRYPADGGYCTSAIDRSGAGKIDADMRRRLVRKGLLEGGPYRRQFRLTTSGKEHARAYAATVWAENTKPAE